MHDNSHKNIQNNIDKNSIRAIAIGCFDGLHLAHQELLKRLGKNGALIIIEDEREKLTKKREEYINLPCFYYQICDIKGLSGKKFIQILESEFVNLEKIVVGYDFKFGRNRAWDAKALKKLFRGEVEIVDEFFLGSSSVHSKNIRSFLKSGDISSANQLLGREYQISGRVVKGQGIGSKLLYATLNLEISGFILPKDGVYATFTNVDGMSHKSVSFIGKRISTDDKFSVESHILEKFSGKSVDKVKIRFVKFIRGNMKFKSLDALKSQISDDILVAKRILDER